MKWAFIFFLAILGLTIGLKAQKPPRGCPEVFFYSWQVTDSVCDPGIKAVGLSFNMNRVKVLYKDGTKQFFPVDSVWGIRYKNNSRYRFYQGNRYSLSEFSPVYKYCRKVGKYSKYYFSTGLDSAIFPYEENYLRKYADSSAYYAIVRNSRTNRHELIFEFYAWRSKIVNRSIGGGGFEIKYYPQKRWGTGLSIVEAWKKITDSFSFPIKSPIISFTELGWLNQYDIIQKRNFRLNLNIVNGLAVSDLRDNAVKERIRTRHGYKYVAKLFAINYYYLFKPGMDISFKLFSNNQGPHGFLTAKIKYRKVFGGSHFGSPDLFSGIELGIGFSLIGFDKMQFSK